MDFAAGVYQSLKTGDTFRHVLSLWVPVFVKSKADNFGRIFCIFAEIISLYIIIIQGWLHQSEESGAARVPSSRYRYSSPIHCYPFCVS